MISAAVGFQCPDCVAAGARETRSNQLPYGGTLVANPVLTTAVLIGANLAIWLAITLTGGSTSRWVDVLSLTPRGFCMSASDATQWYPDATAAACGALADGWWHPGVSTGAYWQVLTSAFTHIDVLHVGMNMLALWFLGPPLERALGRVRFLAVYVLSALAASAVVLWLSNPFSSTLGASGAVFGLIGALLVLARKVHGDVRNVLIWLGINVVYTFAGPGSILWQGHLGGLVGGLAAAAIIVHAPKPNRGRTQVLGLAVLTVLIVAATLVRALQF